MKKIVKMALIALILTSCDPLFHDDFIIMNNCDEYINVTIIFANKDEKSFKIKPRTEVLIFSEEWVGGKSSPEKIDYIFKEITVSCNDNTSKINYVDHKLWKKEDIKSSKRFAYYTDVKYYLYVNLEDFE